MTYKVSVTTKSKISEKLKGRYKGKNSCHWKGGPKRSICIDCRKKTKSKSAKRCQSCYFKFTRGEHHPMWKGGPFKCIDCGKQLCGRSSKSKRCFSCYSKTTLGKNNPNWKNAARYSKCVVCGKKIRKTSSRCKSCANKGELNPSWIDGITPLRNRIARSKKYILWGKNVFKRDKWTCQICDKHGYSLEAHHKKEFIKMIRENNIKTLEEALRCAELWNIKNGITLCKNCHDLIGHKLKKQVK